MLSRSTRVLGKQDRCRMPRFRRFASNHSLAIRKERYRRRFEQTTGVYKLQERWLCGHTNSSILICCRFRHGESAQGYAVLPAPFNLCAERIPPRIGGSRAARSGRLIGPPDPLPHQALPHATFRRHAESLGSQQTPEVLEQNSSLPTEDSPGICIAEQRICFPDRTIGGACGYRTTAVRFARAVI